MCSYMINKKVQPLQGIIQCWFTHPCAASSHIVAILQQHHVQLGLRPCKPVFSPMSQQKKTSALILNGPGGIQRLTSLACWKKAAKQRTEAMKEKMPNPIISDMPATTKSIMDCKLTRPINILSYLSQLRALQHQSGLIRSNAALKWVKFWMLAAYIALWACQC